MRRLIPLFLLVLCAAVPATASAKSVGVIAAIGDQNLPVAIKDQQRSACATGVCTGGNSRLRLR